MNILINATILTLGGGTQVGDSIIRQLPMYKMHNFVVVYPNQMIDTAEHVKKFDNISVVHYNMPKYYLGLVTGRNKFLDDLVNINHIDAVITIFGPSRWTPKVFHLCGIARPHLAIKDSPYWDMLSLSQLIKSKIYYKFVAHSFKKCADAYFTENPYISASVQKLFPKAKVHTITSYYNQIYDFPEQWDRSIKLPEFRGITLLTIAANYPHKNLKIIAPTIHYLKKTHPDLIFRFALTVNEGEIKNLDAEASKHVVFIGPVKINQCPYLYEQSDVMFLPTLMECFSACYAEAMFMERPILTSDLDFAHGLCSNAAAYFNPTSVEDLGEAIFKLSQNITLIENLVANGKVQIKNFDTYKDRVVKLIKIVEESAVRNNR